MNDPYLGETEAEHKRAVAEANAARPRADGRWGRRDKGNNRYFSKAERFPIDPNADDIPQYMLGTTRSRVGTVFGSSTRADYEKSTRPAANANVGPGSYKISSKAMNANSQYIENKAIKFAQCPRPSMALGFRSPGPIYQLDGVFQHGRDVPLTGVGGKIMPGFNKDHRKPLVNAATEATYDPKLPKGVSFTIATRFTPSKHSLNTTPSPAAQDYDHVAAYKRINKPPSIPAIARASDRFKGEDKVVKMMRDMNDPGKLLFMLSQIETLNDGRDYSAMRSAGGSTASRTPTAGSRR